jgi:hypothetical protein
MFGTLSRPRSSWWDQHVAWFPTRNNSVKIVSQPWGSLMGEFPWASSGTPRYHPVALPSPRGPTCPHTLSHYMKIELTFFISDEMERLTSYPSYLMCTREVGACQWKTLTRSSTVARIGVRTPFIFWKGYCSGSHTPKFTFGRIMNQICICEDFPNQLS